MEVIYAFLIFLFSIFCLILWPSAKPYWECDKIQQGHYLIDKSYQVGSAGTSRVIYRGTILESGARKSMNKKYLNRKMPKLFTTEVILKIRDRDTTIAIPVFYDTTRFNRIALWMPSSCVDKAKARRNRIKGIVGFLVVIILPMLYFSYQLRRSILIRISKRKENTK